jgi:predicted dienelactone hydrolase
MSKASHTLICTLSILAAVLLVAPPSARADEPVGRETLRVPERTAALRGDTTGSLAITVWYPAASGAAQAEHVIGSDEHPLFLTGKWQEHAPPAAGRRFPLIAISHGTGGSAMQISWLAAPLAAHGYVVVAVDHPGNSLDLYTPAGFGLWWLRPGDISLAIDSVLQDARFRPIVDPARIGAAGFSLGGYTVLELAGARTDLARFADYCERTKWFACDGPPELPKSESKLREQARTDPEIAAAMRDADRSYRDPRIKAIFAIAPAVIPALDPQSLSAITVPTFITAGRGDPLVSVWDNAVPAAKLIPNAQLLLLSPAVGHYTFLDQCTELARSKLANLCPTPIGVQQNAHDETVFVASRFFDDAL